MMKNIWFYLLFSILVLGFCAKGQNFSPLNTAANCTFMKPVEQEMVYEINLLRSNPKGYIQYLEGDFEQAKKMLEIYGKGEKSYAIRESYETIGGIERHKGYDTIWNYQNEEEVKALESLIQELSKLSALSILYPDKGMYEAAVKHTNDQTLHHWELGHRGSDGSWPWDRIKRYSGKMKDGNENLAGAYPEPSARDIVIQLLVDSGIPGYGHRENILNPAWTHVACLCAGLHEDMYQWIQEFGSIK
jgi:uncharacterized protein YkwD